MVPIINPITPRSARANPKICRPELAISSRLVLRRPSGDWTKTTSTCCGDQNGLGWTLLSFSGSLRLACYRRACSWTAGKMARTLIKTLSVVLSRHLLLRRTLNGEEAAGACFLGGFCSRWAGTRTQFRLITCGAKNTWSIVTSLLPEPELLKRLRPTETKVFPIFNLKLTAEQRYVAYKDLFVVFNENTYFGVPFIVTVFKNKQRPKHKYTKTTLKTHSLTHHTFKLVMSKYE